MIQRHRALVPIFFAAIICGISTSPAASQRKTVTSRLTQPLEAKKLKGGESFVLRLDSWNPVTSTFALACCRGSWMRTDKSTGSARISSGIRVRIASRLMAATGVTSTSQVQAIRFSIFAGVVATRGNRRPFPLRSEGFTRNGCDKQDDGNPHPSLIKSTVQSYRDKARYREPTLAIRVASPAVALASMAILIFGSLAT